MDGPCPVPHVVLTARFFRQKTPINPGFLLLRSFYFREVAAMCGSEELGEVGIVPLGESLRAFRSSHASCMPVEFADGFESSSQDEFNFSFGADGEDELSIAASGAGLRHRKLMTWLNQHPRALSFSPKRTLRWWSCLPRQPRASGWSGLLHPVPSARGWMIGFWVRTQCLSSWKCTRNCQNHGRPLSRPGHSTPAPLSSPPSDGSPGRGYTEVPQVGRAIVVHHWQGIWTLVYASPILPAGFSEPFGSDM